MRIVRHDPPAHRSRAPAPGGFARSPWSGLETKGDRLFEIGPGDLGGSAPATRVPDDLDAEPDNTCDRAEFRGVNRDDLNVEAVDGHLTRTAARETPAADGKAASSPSRSAARTRGARGADARGDLNQGEHPREEPIAPMQSPGVAHAIPAFLFWRAAHGP